MAAYGLLEVVGSARGLIAASHKGPKRAMTDCGFGARSTGVEIGRQPGTGVVRSHTDYDSAASDSLNSAPRLAANMSRHVVSTEYSPRRESVLSAMNSNENKARQ